MASFRYVRLAIPLFFAATFVHFILINNLNYNMAVPSLSRVYNFKASIYELLKFSFYDAMLSGNIDLKYVPPAWTLPIEFYASCGIFIFLYLFGKHKYRSIVYFLFSLLFINNLIPILYSPFLIGLIISDCYHQIIKKHFDSKIVIFAKIVLLFFISYLFFILLDICPLPGISFKPYIWEIIVQTTLFIAVLMFPLLQKPLSSRLSCFLGRISFSLYLTHGMIMCSFSAFIFHFCKTHKIFPVYLSVFTIIIGMSVSIFFAYLFTIIVEERVLTALKKVFYNPSYFLEHYKKLVTTHAMCLKALWT